MTQLKNYYKNYMHSIDRPTNLDPDALLNDLTLIDLSKHLYEIAMINQHYQEIEFNSNFLKKMDQNHKDTICEQLLLIHKKISYFIIKNKDIDASV